MTDLIERLRQARCSVAADYVVYDRLCGEAADALEARDAEITRLRRELTEAQKDAARYRWLRLRIPVTAIHCRRKEVTIMPADCGEPSDESYAVDVDAAIDAALEVPHG